ncbi:CypX Cytochrome P450 [Pyrenophora tritici-repentis]|uniref:Cytochrome P450 n=2 Tax=Pyrenophora tritici-repentis TaxID=45151 RepID=A0A2W1DLM1_9PLEO|nr:pisatin demethylase [Pyrenophora tritici-repentis Pt-1C-BFP]KAF7568819.1 CypX, Cytochrome P450 [Pyrenophora tritici-repentis]EDU46193.1 pisatin demethylase [Pyrenophora tritici-repentis Pt-1C-BFP]KAG9376262.1 Cytochrome P450 [Pyrenophora tritici-repentis]KAI0570749.1 Cytochrome P450 [Pyrenophora tritici-repentis]KAI1511879.1 Cytochrome P450 [Pyrenophora tritici-repentis]
MANLRYTQQLVGESSHGRYYIYGLVALLVFVVIKYVWQILASPLRTVPGPFLARFTRLWEIKAVCKYDNPTYNIALHEKYGPIVRLAPNRYSINDGEAAKVILGHHNAMDKSQFYHPFGQPEEYNLFSEPSISVHANVRRPIAQLYSQTTLLSYEPFVETCNTILLKRLEEYARNGKALNVRNLMQYYAFDVIGEITVGSRFGLMEDGGDKSGIVEAIDESMTYAAIIGLIPEWHWWIGMTMDKLRLEPGFRKILNFVNLHVDSRVSGRTKSPEDRSDFLDKMLPMEREGKATRFHTRQVASQNIAAGSDTTAISLSAIIAYLAMHPNTLAVLRHELDEATAAGTLSDPATFQEAQKLPYLQAVIMEALRVHPAVGAPMTRVVGPQGLVVAGQFFPPGTEVGVNAWVIHNNRTIFGPDAHIFRPERWITKNKEERAVLDRNFLAFGAGPRTCIGKNISLLEMSKVIPQIVRKYDFEILSDANGEKYTWRTRWFAKPSFNAIVRRRAQKA